jgi:hypothetical protein
MRLKGLLSPRGAVEYFESDWHMRYYPRFDQKSSRSEKFKFAYEKNNLFAKYVEKRFGRRNVPTKEQIGMLAENLHTHCSKGIHEYFNLSDAIVVDNTKMVADQLKLLGAICDTLGIEIKYQQQGFVT